MEKIESGHTDSKSNIKSTIEMKAIGVKNEMKRKYFCV